MEKRKRLIFIACCALLLMSISAKTAQQCRLLSLDNTAIQDKDGATIYVDSSIVLFGDKVSFSNFSRVPEQIMLCLDYSGSMVTNDPNVDMPAAARAYVDSIVKYSPESWVGVVVYSAAFPDPIDNLDTACTIAPIPMNVSGNPEKIKAAIHDDYGTLNQGGTHKWTRADMIPNLLEW
jgi:hypothetical protein